VISLQLTSGRIACVGHLSIIRRVTRPRKFIERVGIPRHGFFIYYDDVKYAYRILKVGFLRKYVLPIVEHMGWPHRRTRQYISWVKNIPFQHLQRYKVENILPNLGMELYPQRSTHFSLYY